MIPPVHWTLDGHPITLKDWIATTVANGGFDSLRAVASGKDRRKYPSSFEQGAPIVGSLPSGRIVWEGELSANPLEDAGLVEIGADGPMVWAEEADGQLLYQSRDISLWSDEGSAPYNGSPSSTIRASVSDGALYFEIPKDTVLTTNDAHAVVLWLSPSSLRRLRGTLYVTGQTTSLQFRVLSATGPTGSRTLDTALTPTNGLLIDTQPASPKNMLAVELRSTANRTTTADLQIYFRDVRVNDLTTLDEFTISDLAADVGRRLAWDVDGIPVAPGIDTATPEINTFVYIIGDNYDPTASIYTNLQSGGLTMGPGHHQPAVVTSPLNALPVAWGGRFGGNWAGLLDHVAAQVDWRWRVIGNAFGKGPLLQFGPYGPTWMLRTSKNARPQFASKPIRNVVEVRYHTADGASAVATAKRDPDPLRHRGRRERKHVVVLPNAQKDGALAQNIANILINEVGQQSVTGSLEIVGVDNPSGTATIYDVTAGDLAVLSDYGPAGVQPMRIAHTEMSPKGVRVGIGDYATVAAMMADQDKKRLRAHSGALTRTVFLPPVGNLSSGVAGG